MEADVLLVPPTVATVMLTTPAEPGGETAVIWVAEFTVYEVALLVPNFTALAPVASIKLVPVMVMDVPPAVGPLAGVMALTVGAAT